MKSPAIVLRETNYKEADKILTVLTRDLGKRTVKARGCRRKSSKITAAAQLLVYSDMVLFERQERYTLHEAATKESFWSVRQDIVLLALSSYFAEVLEAVAQEGQPHSELLSLILNCMYGLDTLKKEPALVKGSFELAVMCDCGYAPYLDGCALCGGEAKEARLNLNAGVLHCKGCRSPEWQGVSLPLTDGVLQAMRHVTDCEPKRLLSFSLQPEGLGVFSDVCEAFLLAQLERGFRTLDFYKQLNAVPLE